MSAAVAYAPNRYSRVHLNTALLKGYPLHCIIFRTETDPHGGTGNLQGLSMGLCGGYGRHLCRRNKIKERYHVRRL